MWVDDGKSADVKLWLYFLCSQQQNKLPNLVKLEPKIVSCESSFSEVSDSGPSGDDLPSLQTEDEDEEEQPEIKDEVSFVHVLTTSDGKLCLRL